MSDQIEDHVLERFEVLKNMGKGAYGIVWKVREKRSQQIFALKKIYDAFYNEVDAQRTYREVMYLRELKDHENIIKLEEVIRSLNNKDLYLVFEYMDADLHQVIKSDILAEIHKKCIIYQLFKALKFVHSAGLVHRDMKPSNLLIDSDCLIKIADFGLARSIRGKEGSDPVVSEYVATRWYRAPEILLGSRSYSQAVDVWSAGCIVAELFLGKVLFPGKGTLNQMELLIQLLDKPTPEDILALGSHHTESIVEALSTKKSKSFTLIFSMMGKLGIDLLRRMLVYNPEKRITVDEVLSHPYLKEFSQREMDLPTRGPIILPVDDSLKMSVGFYRESLYKMVCSPMRTESIPSKGIMIDQQTPTPNQKGSTSKDRVSTKDISEDKRSQAVQSFSRAKRNKIATDFQCNSIHGCSQITSGSGKKSMLVKKKSVEKKPNKKSQILKKKRSLDGLLAVTEEMSKKKALVQSGSKGDLLKTSPMSNLLNSSTVLLRRHSNIYQPEERQIAVRKERKKSQVRSISPTQVVEESKALLHSLSNQGFKRPQSPKAKNILHNLIALEKTEHFFKQFETFKRKTAQKPPTTSTLSKPTLQKTIDSQSIRTFQKKSKPPTHTLSSNHRSPKALLPNSHMLSLLKNLT